MFNPQLLNFIGFRPTGDLGPWTMYTNKRGRAVWFIKAPPTSPPTARQLFIRAKLTDIANGWTKRSEQTKMNWEKASKRANLRMTGYNLWQWWYWHGRRKIMETIERQTGIDLI